MNVRALVRLCNCVDPPASCHVPPHARHEIHLTAAAVQGKWRQEDSPYFFRRMARLLTHEFLHVLLAVYEGPETSGRMDWTYTHPTVDGNWIDGAVF